MNDFVIAILLIIGVATVLLLVRLLWYWMTDRLGNSQEHHTATIANTPRETFTSNYTTVLEKEHQLYEELNARHRATGEKCNDTMCGFPELNDVQVIKLLIAGTIRKILKELSSKKQKNFLIDSHKLQLMLK